MGAPWPTFSNLERVEKARASLPVPAVLDRAETTLRALADPTRLSIVVALASVGELCVSDLARLLGARLNLVSAHLRILRLGRVIQRRAEGRAFFYSLLDERARDAVEQLLRPSSDDP